MSGNLHGYRILKSKTGWNLERLIFVPSLQRVGQNDPSHQDDREAYRGRIVVMVWTERDSGRIESHAAMPTKPKVSHTAAKFPVTDADWEALLTAAPDSVDDPDTRLIDWSNATLTPGGGVAATLNALRRARGPQRAATKQPVNLRLSPEVVTWFRATGKG